MVVGLSIEVRKGGGGVRWGEGCLDIVWGKHGTNRRLWIGEIGDAVGVQEGVDESKIVDVMSC